MVSIRLFIPLIFTLLATATPFPARGTPPDIPGPSRRGVAYNDPEVVRLFLSDESKITWCYNWDSRTGATNTPYEFVPMLHSLRTDHIGRWRGDAERAINAIKTMPTHLLTFNEPDNCEPYGGGSCMSVDAAVAGWQQHVQPLKSLKELIYIGAPAVSNAGGDNAGLGWLEKFLGACTGCSIDFICIHWYDRADNVAYFKQHIANARRVAQGRPIWITEFKPSGTDAQVKQFLNEVIPWMDASSDIHRYAYFMARPGSGLLVNDAQTGLSDVGSFYHHLS
ncbi:hypothetical protein ACN47E_000246 [Coniothyrium glycines]